jgi:serine/threonine-protein kinase RsbW
VAAHADLTIEQIDDLRLAVDEAFAVLIAHQPDSGEVAVSFLIQPAVLEIHLTGPSGGPEPDRSSFSWTVLQALVHEVLTDSNAMGEVTLKLTAKVVASA